jgi:hypothetical protein
VGSLSFWQNVTQYGIAVFAVAAVVVCIYGITGPSQSERKRLAPLGLVIVFLSAALLALSVPFFNHMSQNDLTASSRDASMVATYADILSKPNTPAEANRVFASAVSKARSFGNLVITYRPAGDYRYNLIASDGHGINDAAVCISYLVASRIWLPSTVRCS